MGRTSALVGLTGIKFANSYLLSFQTYLELLSGWMLQFLMEIDCGFVGVVLGCLMVAAELCDKQTWFSKSVNWLLRLNHPLMYFCLS